MCLFCGRDESRFYFYSHTKARQPYLCYEKKTDIRACDVYMDAGLECDVITHSFKDLTVFVV